MDLEELRNSEALFSISSMLFDRDITWIAINNIIELFFLIQKQNGFILFLTEQNLKQLKPSNFIF